MDSNLLEFFGFKDNPFKITPDPNYYFQTKRHEEVLLHLKYMYESGDGFAVVIGEPGTGKTITIRKFINELPENIEFAYILFPNLSPEQLLIAILEDLKLEVPKDISKNKIFSMFRDFLIKKKHEGKKVFIIIDEAQNLPTETIEELRILSNLETEDEKLLQIVLFGQPELEEKLNSPMLRQLKQRITIYMKLTPLTENEIEQYINYRLAKAGNSLITVSKKAIKLVKKYTKGNPRLINQLMERALIAAFIDEEKSITDEQVKKALESLNINTKTKKLEIAQVIGIIFSFSLLILSLLYVFPIKEIRVSSSIIKNKNTPNKRNIYKDSYYILYVYTTKHYEKAKKVKENLKKFLKMDFRILKVKNDKFYSVGVSIKLCK